MTLALGIALKINLLPKKTPTTSRRCFSIKTKLIYTFLTPPEPTIVLSTLGLPE